MPSPHPRGALALARAVTRVTVLAAVLTTALSGCALVTRTDHDDPRPTPSAQATLALDAPDVVAGMKRALEARARAVRERDQPSFLAGLAADPAFRAAQLTYWANVRQLPIGAFRYSLDPASVLRTDTGDYLVDVRLDLQLTGFDVSPVVSAARFEFQPGAGGALLLASTDDPAWDTSHHVRPQPWDLGPVEVRSAPGVLGIFDPQSVSASAALLAQLVEGIRDVAQVVPYAWSQSVVIYALSDPDYLYSIPDLPAGDPTTLDAVAFPVASSGGSRHPAATRIALNPRLLHRPSPSRDRLLRHELTHVAIGTRDDRAPVWLSEGLAEYVSVRPLVRLERGIPRSAIQAAKAGFTDLPADADFGTEDAAAHYGESWWACEYVAEKDGESRLWTLLHRLNQPDVDDEAVLEHTVDLTSQQLARRAGRLLLLTYKPNAVVATGHGTDH